jgi:hypothetical protein
MGQPLCTGETRFLVKQSETQRLPSRFAHSPDVIKLAQ